VSREEWQEAREELLKREKEHTRMGDELTQARQELPWVRIEEDYRFDTEDGEKTLAELFDGRSQLLVYHFMFGVNYEAGCTVCSSIADAIDAARPHVNARDTTLMCVSRAPLDKLLPYRERMGWGFPWASAGEDGLSTDLGFGRSEDEVREQWAAFLEDPPETVRQMADKSGTTVVSYVSEGPGLSAFAREDGTVYQTYSSSARGLEFFMPYYAALDRAPKGRDEQAGPHWLRRHDEY
jgi:predicted dithiol-disulfide oxidoreductase (DUF899 family)